VITSRPTSAELTRGATLDLEYLINSQALQLTGTLNFYKWRPANYTGTSTMPLEEWNAINPDFVSESTSSSVQAQKRQLREEWLDSVNWVIGSPDQGGASGSNAPPPLPFRLEVSPRIQFFVHITLENANGVFEPEYYSQAHTDRYPTDFNYYSQSDGGFNKWRGSSDWGFGWLDIGMVEGDYIQWDGTYFDVYHYGDLVYRSTEISSNNYIIPLGASNLEQTEAQAQEQGRMDDPLTPDIDETVDLDPDSEGFRPKDYNKNRLLEIRRALAYKNGNQSIGSLFLALLAYGAFMIIRGGE
jgi:hypothetical protein